MNKSVCVFVSSFVVSVLFGQAETRVEDLEKSIGDLKEVLQERPLSSIRRDKAFAEFSRVVWETQDTRSLEPLLNEKGSVFNLSFSEILNRVGDPVSDEIFNEALSRHDYFSEDGRPLLQCRIARDYLVERLDLDIPSEKFHPLYEAFSDPKFIDGLSVIFPKIVYADSAEKKEEAEANAISFIENYEYVSWRERVASKGQEKSGEPRSLRSESDQKEVSQDGNRDSGQSQVDEFSRKKKKSASWPLWVAVGFLIMALVVYLMRRKQRI